MTDLISRQAALEEMHGFYPPKVANESEAEAINRAGWECAINCIEAYLRTVKPVDPVKHGNWTKHILKNANVPWGYDCSACDGWFVVGEDVIKKYRFCPNCGARMDGE